MTEVIRSFIHPVHRSNASFADKKIAFKEAIFFILKGWGIFVLLLLADSLQKKLTNVSLFSDFLKTSRLFEETKGLRFFFFVSFIGPFIEECAFRSFVDRTRLMIALSIGFLFLSFLRVSDIVTIQYKWSVELTLSLVVGLGSFAILEKIKFAFSDNHFRVTFYLMNALFVAMHIGNYDLSTFSVLTFIFLPAVLFPQLILTMALSYVRLKNGLAWAIGLHMLNNLIPALFSGLFKHP